VAATGTVTPPASSGLSDCTVERSTSPVADFVWSALATVSVLIVTPNAVTV